MDALSKTELLALLGAARDWRERDWLMILVAYSHGLRASEVVALTPDNLRDGFLTVQRLKGSYKTTQPLIESNEPLLNERAALVEFAAKSTENQRIFPITRGQFWRVMQLHAESAGLPAHKRHPHILKHTVAMQLIGTAGIENTRQYLGHKSISSTGEYLQVSDQDASSAARAILSGD